MVFEVTGSGWSSTGGRHGGDLAVVESDVRRLILTDSRYDQRSPCHPDTRLAGLFEEVCDWLAAEGADDQLAVDSPYAVLTYHELDTLANQLAHYLLAWGARPGDRIALLLDQGADSYIAMLAVLKIQAAYVPLDPSFPADRIDYILDDAGVVLVISVSALAGRLPELGPDGPSVMFFDQVAGEIGRHPYSRPGALDHGGPVDDLAYLIYTSGTTGRPKGVAITHPNICNFVLVAAQVYGFTETDRVYQGLSVAFDFSVEEIWTAWMVGATLVPKPAGPSLLGEDLHRFLSESHVTALCCVPTLLATITEELPELRFLLVSGEACPRDLMVRWHRPGRRFLNVYGPTEATVSATWTVLDPRRPVTIGAPLPTYSVVILDPERPMARPFGQTGEIGIAGIGLARGYLNRDDLTAKAFIPDFLGIPNNPSGRIYRTGDLGRVTPDGEIEFLGRIDTQVKIRGYRIELTEIESVLLQLPEIGQAVVDTHAPEPGALELVAYYTPRRDCAPPAADQIRAYLRERLPAYMVPAYLEPLAVIPMTSSDKADRKALPPPTGPRGGAVQGAYVAPSTPLEELLAEQLEDTLRLDAVSVDSDFFASLGADSLLMARFLSKLRALPELAATSMREIYQNPTIQRLAGALGGDSAGGRRTAPPVNGELVPVPTPHRASTASYVLTGVAQLITYLCGAYLGSAALVGAYDWVEATPGLAAALAPGGAPTPLAPLVAALCGRAVTATMLIAALWVIFPIVLKWLLIGRWRREEIPVWSARYFRFWLVKSAIRANPMRLFVGSPLYLMYLRALGARIGRNVLIQATDVPVCTDLLRIGDGTIIPKDVNIDCYRAHSGVIQTGRITIGRDVFIGGMSMLDIETYIGDSAQLGYTSSLYAGQAIPAGETWHGTPARPADVDYRTVAPERCGTGRKLAYTASQLLFRLGVYPSIAGCALLVLQAKLPSMADPLDSTAPMPPISQLCGDAFGLSALAYFGGLLAALLFVCTVPRLLARLIVEDRVYPLYGLRYACLRTVARWTNNGTLCGLFGDSSFIVHYLRALGYRLGVIEQTGSNFGMAVAHDVPYLCSVGSGTLVSDGLSMINAAYSSTSFRVSEVKVGDHNFIGNGIAYPAGGRTGDNCLLATKVMVPMHGELRENVGLLGSPAFEIPRSVRRDGMLDHPQNDEELRERLRRKDRHNLATIGIHLAVRWVFTFITTVVGLATLNAATRDGAGAVTGMFLALSVLGILYYVLVERVGFKPLEPRTCSIYEPYFWWHERFWKVPAMGYVGAFSGTPFKGVIWRLLGARVGRRLFDDGCWMTERSLVTVGDDCTFGATSTLQAHSLEDGAFKSDHITIGSGCTIATHGFVHYGTTMGDSSVLELDSFLMKGETMTTGDSWLGNPARPAHKGRDESEGYLTQLLRRINALEGEIDHLTQTGPPPRRRGFALAASMALLAAGGGAAFTAYPGLSNAVPAAWHTLAGAVVTQDSPTDRSTAVAQGATSDQPDAADTDRVPAASGSGGAKGSPDTAGSPDSAGTADSPDVADVPAPPPAARIRHIVPVPAQPPRPVTHAAITPRVVRPPTTATSASTTTRSVIPTRSATATSASALPSAPEAQEQVEDAAEQLKRAKETLKQAKAAQRQNGDAGYSNR